MAGAATDFQQALETDRADTRGHADGRDPREPKKGTAGQRARHERADEPRCFPVRVRLP